MDAGTFSEDEPNGRCCPYCGRECDDHLLGFFDRYGEGVGLIGGALYAVEDIEGVLTAVRLAWLRAKGGCPAWAAAVPALRFYFDWLGSLEVEEPSAGESEDDVALQMTWAPGHGSLARDVLRSLLQEECGWRGGTSEWEKDDTPGLSTVYEFWWEPGDPSALADRLREKLRLNDPAAEAAIPPAPARAPGR